MNHKLKPQDQDKEFFWQNLTTSSALESFFFVWVGEGRNDQYLIFLYMSVKFFLLTTSSPWEKYRQIYLKSKVIKR